MWATTRLQPLDAETPVRSKYGYQQVATHAEVNEHIVAPHGLRFTARPMRDLIDDRTAPCQTRLCRHLLRDPVGPSVLRWARKRRLCERIKAIAQLAHSVFDPGADGGARVGLHAVSVARRYDDAEAFFDGKTDPGYYAFRPEHFEYDRLVGHLSVPLRRPTCM